MTNFKSWPVADLTCGRITGLFGTNSSGKTSLIQFLLLMKQTKDATDRGLSLELNGDLVQLGTIKDCIHQHDAAKSMEWSLRFALNKNLQISDPTKGKKSLIASAPDLELSSQVYSRKEAPAAHRLSYRLGEIIFSLAPKNGDSSQFELSSSSTGNSKKIFTFIRTKGRPWQLPGPIKSYAFPDQARTYFQNAGFLADLEAAYEAEMDRIFYLGPLREFPKRDYLWARSRPTDVGQRGEKAIDAILAATQKEEQRNLKFRAPRMAFQEVIAHWLREIGLIEEFSVREIAEGSNRWQAWVKTRSGASEVLLTDVGFGVSQVLPVVSLLQYVPEGSTVILEQPEIHLHPLAQAGLADVIIQAATHRKVQVIVESHSEHLLLRLQRRVAEERVSSEDVKLYFCEAPDGASRLIPLDLDLYGNIRNWPKKFMGDAFTEAAEAELARLRRMSAAE
ncbi:MAG: DUF3696 domain-containing protein [Defluviicoccus sp.]